jgi:hypothetical protein
MERKWQLLQADGQGKQTRYEQVGRRARQEGVRTEGGGIGEMVTSRRGLAISVSLLGGARGSLGLGQTIMLEQNVTEHGLRHGYLDVDRPSQTQFSHGARCAVCRVQSASPQSNLSVTGLDAVALSSTDLHPSQSAWQPFAPSTTSHPGPAKARGQAPQARRRRRFVSTPPLARRSVNINSSIGNGSTAMTTVQHVREHVSVAPLHLRRGPTCFCPVWIARCSKMMTAPFFFYSH